MTDSFDYYTRMNLCRNSQHLKKKWKAAIPLKFNYYNLYLSHVFASKNVLQICEQLCIFFAELYLEKVQKWREQRIKEKEERQKIKQKNV
jgi:hypothetical protein